MKIICIGHNYPAHNREMESKTPSAPIYFLKPDTALLIRNRPFFIPNFSNQVEYEVELLVKICKVGKNIQKKFAPTYYQEIGLGIDFTARDLQHQCRSTGEPWEIAKGFDSSAAVSEFVDKKEFPNLNDLHFKLHLNDTLVQTGNSSEMIFSIDDIIVHISKFMTLKTGDLLFTGTPSGVGKVAINDHLEGWLEDRKLLDFYVK
jgi:2-keto-4-pentenoate hydratase/2-oxohepta-3-ene-1,7-dioic acid hydratase in catechol pathway